MGELIFGAMCFALGSFFSFIITCLFAASSHRDDYILEDDEDDEDDG